MRFDENLCKQRDWQNFMRRVGYLFEGICDLDNLKRAAQLACRGKRKRKDVRRFLRDEEQKLLMLREHLLDGSYRCMPYSKKVIRDKGSGKEREIFVPKFYPDQIVQWAVTLKLVPIIMRGMYDYSCASIPNRGVDFGYKKIRKILKNDVKNSKYCLVCDVKKFYPSIDQNILMDKFRRKIKDERALKLVETIVRSVPSGVPIGNYTSQWFANFFLQDFDHFIKEQLHIKYYIRYMDDIVLIGANKRKLHSARVRIGEFLARERLLLKSNWQVFRVAEDKRTGRPIDFLGYNFYRTFVTVRGRTFLRATRRIRKIAKKGWLTARDSCAVFSYMAKFEKASGQKIYNIRVKPFLNLKLCRRVISRHDRVANRARRDFLAGWRKPPVVGLVGIVK